MSETAAARDASRADADRRDAADPLRALRDAFVLPADLIYLDGNSLGPLSKRAQAMLEKAVREEWGVGLIRSWNAAGWWDLPLVVGNKIGRLIGAAPGQTVIADSTSINIFKTLHAGLSIRPGRRVILAERSSFPTDLYMAEAIARTMAGVELRLVDDLDQDLTRNLDGTVAVVLANQVDYRTGACADIATVTARAQAAGAVIVWDLSHSAGAMPIGLDAAGADFAVGCGYKYLNGGPGAPAFVYAAARHHGAASHPLSGWFGHAAPFDFEASYRPAADMRRFMCGTQPILSLKALQAGLELWDDVSIEHVRAKSIGLTDYFIATVEALCVGRGLTLASPRDATRRGSQVSFAHADGFAIMQNLIARGVIGDFRAPNLIRFGFAPLYVRYRDAHEAAVILADIFARETWRAPEFSARRAVT